jgi:hypothetical protein
MSCQMSLVYFRAHRKGRLIGLALLLVCVSLNVVAPRALAAGDANQASCGNEVSPGFRAYLPDCRAYEMVSPVFKAGFPVAGDTVSADGSRVVGSSFGVFAGGTGNIDTLGNRYEFTRSASGWVTTPLNPPLPQFTDLSPLGRVQDPSISSSGAAVYMAHTSTQSIYEGDLYLRQPDGSFLRVGPMQPAAAVPPTPTGTGQFNAGEKIEASSSDLSHILFSIDSGQTPPPGVASSLWPGDGTAAGTSLYEYVGTGHTGTGTDIPRLVGLDNNGAQISQCGTGVARNPTTFAPGISSGGSTLFFTAAPGGCSGGGTGPATGQLFGRIGDPGSGQAAVNIAGSSGCAASAACDVTSTPTYQGASADGSKVFFTTDQPLSASDHDTTTDIYECGLPGDSGSTPTRAGVVNPCPLMRPISVTGAASGAQVQSVAAISDDGSHVYFVAQGVVTSTPNQYGATATPGANNLYVWERDVVFPSGRTAFIGALASSSPTAQSTSDGRFLIFTDTAQLTPDDTSAAQQLFRYDAQTGELIRVSVGDNGFNNNGNTNSSALVPGLNFLVMLSANVSSHPNIANDGSKIAFSSANGLTPQALNGQPISQSGELAFNVYEWSAGRVNLISDGIDATPNQLVNLYGISNSGRDVFFSTTSQLVPEDNDRQSDLYDARINGGFPPAASSSACSGDACQGPLSATPPDQSPGSFSFSGPGNASPPVATSSSPKPLTRAQKLAKSLRACAKKPKKKRAACRAHARKLYGPRNAHKTTVNRSRRGTR